MSNNLYLDTARLGLASPAAQHGLADFVRLSAEEGLSLNYESLLHQGYSHWRRPLRRRYPGLEHWEGIADLKRALCQVGGFPAQTYVLLAGRSVQLMRLAARLMFARCQSVLFTDLTWPAYRHVLRREARRRGAKLVAIRLRPAILQHRAPFQKTADLVERACRKHVCTGLHLPLVSHDGLRFPIEELAKRLGAERPFIVLDGAQHFAQCTEGLPEDCCDIYVTSVHKWLAAGQPLAAAFFPHPATQFWSAQEARRFIQRGAANDPVLALITQFEAGAAMRFSETVNLTPLFPCRAAIADWLGEHADRLLARVQRRVNAMKLAQVGAWAGWQPLRGGEAFTSAIVTLQSQTPAVCKLSPEALRAYFARRGITLTAYPNGRIRLSARQISPWTRGQLAKLRCALSDCPSAALVSSARENASELAFAG